MYDMKALYEAESVENAVALRLKHPEAQIIAGGSDVLVQMREGKRAGKELISIYGLDELRGVSIDEEENIRIGSLSSFSHITRDPIIQKYINVLGEAVDMVGGPQIRNIGTIGGNTCNGVTSADSASTLHAWEAIVELTGKDGIRRLPIKDFYIKAGQVDIRVEDGEIQTAEREIVDEAYAGDIIGVFDPGIFSIGDTITMPGKKFRFSGIPTFEPEHFMLVSPKDTMKRKQFVKGVEQIAQEGAIQIFKIPDSGFEDVVVGVVGTLQFDVFEYRMKNEYGVDLRMSGLPYEHLRLIRECPCDVKDLMLCSGSRVLEDFKGRKLIAFGGEWSVGFLTKHNEGLILDDWLSV